MNKRLLDIETLKKAVSSAAAIRLRRRLQPAGGAGDKVFPPTYEGGIYALEDRVFGERRLPCVLLDSVQSQANRMELALLSAHRSGRITIPVVSVDFASVGVPEIGSVSSLDAPHRLADAILRDSLMGGVKFRETDEGRALDTATNQNATHLFRLCPTALVFGLWDSTGARGGMGAKFQRALVGEIVGVDVVVGVKPSSRIDPLGIVRDAGLLYEHKEGGGQWTLNETEAASEKGKPKKFGKDGKPSEANHGNVKPSFKNEKGELHHGGVTMVFAQQTVVLSLPALRRLQFPLDPGSPQVDLAARTVLAALGLCGATLAVEQGADLRSRCLLVPDSEHSSVWEIIAPDGSATAVSLDGDAKPKESGLTLVPTQGLTELVIRSRAIASQPEED
jgi:CRISPR-associated protein Csb1